jgi:serine/threonine protein phosphatase PrpC
VRPALALRDAPNVHSAVRQANLKGEDRFLFCPLMLAKVATIEEGRAALNRAAEGKGKAANGSGGTGGTSGKGSANSDPDVSVHMRREMLMRSGSISAGFAAASSPYATGDYQTAVHLTAAGSWEVLPEVAELAEAGDEEADDLAQRLFHLYAILDGHNGWQCAEFLRRNLLRTLSTYCKGAPPMDRSAVRKAIVYLHRKFCSLGWGSGSTLTLVVVQGWRVLCVNVGDSRGVLDTEVFALPSPRGLKQHHSTSPDNSNGSSTSSAPMLTKAMPDQHNRTLGVGRASGAMPAGDGSAHSSVHTPPHAMIRTDTVESSSTVENISVDLHQSCHSSPPLSPVKEGVVSNFCGKFCDDGEVPSESSIEEQIMRDKSMRGSTPALAVAENVGHYSDLMLRSITATRDADKTVRFMHVSLEGVVQVTEEHRFQSPDDAEAKRVKRAGGVRVSQMQMGATPMGPFRVWPGGMCCSRSIGDWDVWGHVEDPEYVPCEPNVFETELSPALGGRLVIASDGLWDTMGGGDVARLGRKMRADRCAKHVLQKSIKVSNGPRDDTTLCVIDLRPPQLDKDIGLFSRSGRSRSRAGSECGESGDSSGSQRGSVLSSFMERLNEMAAAEQTPSEAVMSQLRSYVHMPGALLPPSEPAGQDVEGRVHGGVASGMVPNDTRSRIWRFFTSCLSVEVMQHPLNPKP